MLDNLREDLPVSGFRVYGFWNLGFSDFRVWGLQRHRLWEHSMVELLKKKVQDLGFRG